MPGLGFGGEPSASKTALLYLLSRSRKLVGRTRLQKLVFLLLVEGLRDPEDYRVHYYGPYSDQVKMDAVVLAAQGYITSEDVSRHRKKGSGFYTIYKITDSGSQWINANKGTCFGDRLPRVESLADKYLGMTTQQLLEYVYAQYVRKPEAERIAIRNALRGIRRLWEDREMYSSFHLLGAAAIEYAEKAADLSTKLRDKVHRNIVLGACTEVYFAAVECMKGFDEGSASAIQLREAFEGAQKIASKYKLLPNFLEDDDPDLEEFLTEEEYERLGEVLSSPLDL